MPPKDRWHDCFLPDDYYERARHDREQSEQCRPESKYVVDEFCDPGPADEFSQPPRPPSHAIVRSAERTPNSREL